MLQHCFDDPPAGFPGKAATANRNKEGSQLRRQRTFEPTGGLLFNPMLTPCGYQPLPTELVIVRLPEEAWWRYEPGLRSQEQGSVDSNRVTKPCLKS
jgi:hypothetical protein